MPSMNKVVLIGRLTRDPETRHVGAEGNACCNFSIAVDRRFKGKDGERKTDFFKCVVWRQTADFVQQYVTKGDLVAVSGSVEINEYTAQDGTRKTSVEVQCDSVELLTSRAEKENRQGQAQHDDRPAEPRGAAARPGPAAKPVDLDAEDDPFADQ